MNRRTVALIWLIAVMCLAAWGTALWCIVHFALLPAGMPYAVALLTGGSASVVYLSYRLLRRILEIIERGQTRGRR